MMTAISETRPGFSQQLVSRRNGQATLTDKGMLAHELVRKEQTLKNSGNPGISYAMSPEMVDTYSQRVNELGELLDLPEDSIQRRKRIARYERRLANLGFPYWREINGSR